MENHYPSNMLPMYAVELPTQILPGHPIAPGTTFSNFVHGHISWKPITILNGYKMYRSYEPIYIPPMQPHQQPLLPIPSYDNPHQQRLPQQSVPSPSLYQQNIDDVLVLDLTYTADDHDREYEAYRMKREAELEGHLDIKRYSSSTNQSSEASSDHDMCIVCQSEYEDNEKIGTIKECGHQYHLNCIKKWLKRKNLCPICKATAFTKGGMVIKPRERSFGDYNEWL